MRKVKASLCSSSQFCGCDARLAAPVQIYGNSRGKNDEAEDAVRRIRDDRARDDRCARQDKERRRVGMAWDAVKLCFVADFGSLSLVAPAKNKKGSGGQRERNEIDRDNVVENLLVASRERNNRSGDALQDDRDDRCAGLWRQPADAFEKQSVASHRVVDARRRENALAEKAQR